MNAGVVIGGDKNDLNITPLLDGIPRLRQIVTKPTLKSKVLDIMLTNMHALYCVPIIAPPVDPDDPLCGVPSDHSTPIAIPLSGDTLQQVLEYITRVNRPLLESGILEFGEWNAVRTGQLSLMVGTPLSKYLHLRNYAMRNWMLFSP